MTAKKKEYMELECHRKFAVDLFNLVWSLLDKKDRTKEEDNKMVHAAHVSRFHWGEIVDLLTLEGVNGRFPVSIRC